MMQASFINRIKLNDVSAVPKYVQLANAVIDAVKHKFINFGDTLPSIHDLSLQLRVSRDTVEKSYKMLKNQDVISAKRGKGCYVNYKEVDSLKIAVFLNKISESKKAVYDAMVEELGGLANVNLFIYHSDLDFLKNALLDHSVVYDYYVVFPHFKEGRDRVSEVLSEVLPEKLIVVGSKINDLDKNISVVFENYEDDLYEALRSIQHRLTKYKTIKLAFPDHSDYPRAIIKGFYRFCKNYQYEHELVEDFESEKMEKGTCYITLTEDHLISLLNKVDDEKIIGNDIGVISYNETPLKKYIMNGITTFSTDFEKMGKFAAQRILSQDKTPVQVPFHVCLRSSV